ncbi:NAD(P)-binding protein [Arthrobacter oryzae]|uniref:NAD(P)-binding protein n=1 Tax=Arthrobacter oryzae TaxID=409290 RepID=UPI002181EA30|nr:NAD(P)-binding protein [Arthrobacter oryzae]
MNTTPAADAGTTAVDTVIIGAGQSGLALGYYLAQQRRNFVILDAGARVGDAWRRRWDSLRLFTPAKYDGSRFHVTAGGHRWTAANVVLATGSCHLPKTPGFAAELASDVVQLHSHNYRNPAQLKPGPVRHSRDPLRRAARAQHPLTGRTQGTADDGDHRDAADPHQTRGP